MARLHTAPYETYETPANPHLSTGAGSQDFTPRKNTDAEPVAHGCAVDLEAYREARRKAVLAVVEALFDEVFEQPEDEWGLRVGEVLRECKLAGAPFDVAWSVVCDSYPPPISWLPYSARERDALAARGYTPDTSRRGKKGDEGVFAFTFRVLRDAYEV